jgi:hypothetical protein
MNNPEHPETAAVDAKEMMTAMFASLVMQQTNMATIFLGLAPHPQTGKMATDLEHAKYFIDQLEMLEAKTRGNLDKREEGLLKQSLTSLRLAFVEAVSNPAPPAAEVEKSAAPAAAAEPSGPVPGAAPQAEAAGPATGAETGGSQPAGPAPQAHAAGPAPQAAADDSRKKFTKKY